MTPMLCKLLGHSYSFNWVCTRCGDHAGFTKHIADIVRAAVQEAKREAPTPAKPNLCTCKPPEWGPNSVTSHCADPMCPLHGGFMQNSARGAWLTIQRKSRVNAPLARR